MFVFQRLSNKEWGKLGVRTHCCNCLCILDLYKFVSSLGRWSHHSTYHVQRAEGSAKRVQGRICLCNGNCHAAVLTASLACGWSRLKKYVLWRSIRERLISGKEVMSRCNSPDKVSQNTDRAGPGVWAECEAGLLQGGSESPFWQPVLPTHLQRKQS